MQKQLVPHVQEVYHLARVKKFIDRKSKNSSKTGHAYLSALVKLNDYLSQEGKDCNTIIDALTNKNVDVYDLLDGYISYLPTVKDGITANTIGNYIAALRSYLALYDIDVVSAKFKHKVSLPKKINQKETPIDITDVRKILLSCGIRRLKAYLLVLASSGLRADTEACSIRNKDIDFTKSPTSIFIRGEYTKTKTDRSTYITLEATKYLQEFIQFRGTTEPEQLLFNSYDKPTPTTIKDTKRMANNIYCRLNTEFMRLLKVVGMDEKKENGVMEKRRHLIHLHSFRRLTYTVINEQVNTAFAEFILGHQNSVYHTEKEAKIRDIYKTKCMPALTVLDYEPLEQRGKNIEIQLEQKDKEIESLKNTLTKVEEGLDSTNKKLTELWKKMSDRGALELMRDPEP